MISDPKELSAWSLKAKRLALCAIRNNYKKQNHAYTIY